MNESHMGDTEPMPAAQPGGSGGGRPSGLGGAAGLVAFVCGAALTAGLCLGVSSSVTSAKERLLTPVAEAATQPQVAVAAEAEVGYCTPRFKEVLERVLHSCGLSGGETRRGCKPADVKTFASISDEDFNELFTPLKERGAVLRFESGSHELDAQARKMLEEKWFERRGARYFFVVARASKTGTPAQNRALSHRRANSVMFHLGEMAGEPPAELERKVGLLWLGNEYAQLSKDYCDWPSSHPEDKCGEEPINRSAFVSWVDCRL